MRLFSKPVLPPRRLPSGTFTVDREGRVVISTVSSSFPTALLYELGQQVIQAFRDSHEADLPLGELVLRYASLKITARELRGGAIVFLAPQTPISPTV